MGVSNRSAFVMLGTCILIAPAFSQDSDVSGIVRDDAGRPCAGIWISGFRHTPPPPDEVRVQSDNQGHLELKAVGRPLFFFAPKLQPTAYVRGPQESSFAISLKANSAGDWPPTCSQLPETCTRYRWPFRFFVSRGAEVHRVAGTDDTSRIVKWLHSTTNGQQVIESRPLVSGLSPENWLLNSPEFEERDFDWRGVSPSGKKWRWFHGLGTIVGYENASTDTARFFDEIIGSVCVAPLLEHVEAQAK